MKAFYLILTSLLLTCNVFANEYENAKFSCSITGDQSNITNIELKNLGTTKTFDLELVSVKETGRVVKIIQSDKSIITIKKAAKSQYLSNRIYLTIKKLSRKQTKKALEALGAVDVPKLPRGAKFPKLSVDKDYYSFYDNSGKAKTQVHFKPGKHDGLSYHIYISCRAQK